MRRRQDWQCSRLLDDILEVTHEGVALRAAATMVVHRYARVLRECAVEIVGKLSLERIALRRRGRSVDG